MKLKLLLSIIFPPIMFFAGLIVASVILTFMGLGEIDDFVAEAYVTFSAWFLVGAFVAVVLLPIFYYVLWSKGDVDKTKIKDWLIATSFAVLICILGNVLVYISSLILENAQLDRRIYGFTSIGFFILAPIVSIIFGVKKRKIIVSSITKKFSGDEHVAQPVKTSRPVLRWCAFGLFIISVINAVSLVSLQAWWMAALSICLGAILFNLSRENPVKLLKKAALVITLICMIAATPVSLNQLTHGIRHIGDKATSSGPAALSYPTRFGLWWSAIWLSIGGVAYLTPYTVAEQVLMFWPGKKERLWNSSFPMKAKKVRLMVKRAKENAKNQSASFKHNLLWKSYCQDNCDVGLALNGGDLTIDITDQGKRCVATARVSVSYKPQYRGSTILGYGGYRLRIDQAAYWALQELGWLYPYELRYRWLC